MVVQTASKCRETQPSSFTYGRTIYFTAITAATVGYGDMVAQTNEGRTMAVVRRDERDPRVDRRPMDGLLSNLVFQQFIAVSGLWVAAIMVGVVTDQLTLSGRQKGAVTALFVRDLIAKERRSAAHYIALCWRRHRKTKGSIGFFSASDRQCQNV